jgi:hypothetical protein
MLAAWRELGEADESLRAFCVKLMARKAVPAIPTNVPGIPSISASRLLQLGQPRQNNAMPTSMVPLP